MELKVHPALVKSCRYVILPGKCPPHFPQRDLYDRAYIYWRDFWNQFFDENGLAGSLHPDDFFRQDFIPVILHGEEIVGMHLYTQFDLTLAITSDLSYFKRSFNEVYLKHLQKKGVQTAMSLEFLTVNPEWRKSKTGVSFAQILIGVEAKLQKYLGIDAGIAISRSDIKVTQIGFDFGWDVVMSNVILHTKPCDLIALFNNKIQDHPDPVVRGHIDFFWKNRVDLTGKLSESRKGKRAA